jgi:hypothetical protein
VVGSSAIEVATIILDTYIVGISTKTIEVWDCVIF